MKALTYMEHGQFALAEKPKPEFVDAPLIAKLRPITYDPMNHHYLVLGKKVGQAFHDGLCMK